MASFSKFLIKHKKNKLFQDIIQKGLDRFINHQILQFQNAKEIPIHFIGSVSFYLKDGPDDGDKGCMATTEVFRKKEAKRLARRQNETNGRDKCLNKPPEVELSSNNIMGVVVPSVSGTNLKSTFKERGVGFIGSSPYIDEAGESFGNLIEKIVKASEMEATLKRLLQEIEATKRRVNALEYKVIPELEEARVFIQLRLEEMEREETFRLKRFKNK